MCEKVLNKLGLGSVHLQEIEYFPMQNSQGTDAVELRVIQLLLPLQKEQCYFVLIGNSREPLNNWKITYFVRTSEITETSVSIPFVKL